MELSRIALTLLPIMAIFSAPAFADVTELAPDARVELSISDDECESNGRQIVVCADQNVNDRYRLPFETAVAGDPDAEGVWGERERIQANPGTCQSTSFFRAGCGAVGVSAGVGFGGGGSGFQTGGLRRVGQ